MTKQSHSEQKSVRIRSIKLLRKAEIVPLHEDSHLIDGTALMPLTPASSTGQALTFSHLSEALDTFDKGRGNVGIENGIR